MELLFGLGFLIAGLFVAVGILKFLLFLFVLPFKLAIGLAKGLIGLVIGVPLLIITALAFTGILPVLVVVVALPVLAGVALLAGLFHLVVS